MEEGMDSPNYYPSYYYFSDEEKSLSDSSSDTSDDSDGNWKRRKRMDGNEVKQKYPSSSSDADSDEMENDPPRLPCSPTDADSDEKKSDPLRYPSSSSDADSDEMENDPPRYSCSPADADSDEKENDPLSDSSSNTSDDSNGNWKRSKRMDGNELMRKRVRYSSSSSDVDSYQFIKEYHPLRDPTTSYVSELEDLSEIAQSVGAIFILDHADHPHLVGTCFRIGERYIVTNKHLLEEIFKMPNDRFYVNFNFNKEGEADSKRSFIESVMMCSAELDYAILRMENAHEQLPPCIFSHGVSIMNPAFPESNLFLLGGKPLRLTGHPRGEPKQIDSMCPIYAHPQSGLESWCYTMRRGPKFEGEAAKDYYEATDPRRITYQTSNFFHGSGGSPGIVHQNNKKWLVVLHTRGFADDKGNFLMVQGVLLTEIFKDVQKQLNEAQQGPLKKISVEDLFPSVDCAIQAC